jgi:hypothetical protein
VRTERSGRRASKGQDLPVGAESVVGVRVVRRL